MILKLSVSLDYPSDSWLWLDGIVKCQSYGMLRNPTEENPDSLMFYGQEELLRAVEKMWGSTDGFSDQIWPEFSMVDGGVIGRYVNCFRVERADRSCVLVLATGQAFLMSDAGNTVERLN